MKVLVFIIGMIFLAGVFVAACVAVVNDDDDSLGRIEFVSHRDCDPSWDDCGDNDYRQDYGSEDRNRNRHRNRGAFSPGPFDRSPIEMHDVCISLDCSDGRDKDRRDGDGGQHPKAACLAPVPFHCDPAPASLFPPSPDGIRAFVVSTIRAGVEMGRLFADTTISFVANLLVGIATVPR